MDMRKGLFGLLIHGPAVGVVHHLWQVANGESFWARQCSLGGLLFAGNDFEQCALSRTVLSHKRNAVLLVYYEADIVEQVGSAKVYSYVIY
jgi:hypothetical protein